MRCVGSIDRFLRPGQRASRLGVAVFAARGLRRRRLAARPSPRVAVCDARVESSRSAATRGYGAI
jgi:hypothetical protein